MYHICNAVKIICCLPPAENVGLVYHFNVGWNHLIVFITSLSESSVGCRQVPLSVSPSAHSWTVYSTKLLFSGTVLNKQTHDGKRWKNRTCQSVKQLREGLSFLELEPNLRWSSGDGLHSQLCTADEPPPVGGQGDAGGVHGLLALHRQQEGAGGAGLLELLWGVCVDQGNICTEVPTDQTGLKVTFLPLSFPDSPMCEELAEVRLGDCSAGV